MVRINNKIQPNVISVSAIEDMEIRVEYAILKTSLEKSERSLHKQGTVTNTQKYQSIITTRRV